MRFLGLYCLNSPLNKGKSVTLTIDATIQFIAERALDKSDG